MPAVSGSQEDDAAAPTKDSLEEGEHGAVPWWTTLWRFPLTRIAAFAVVLLAFYAAFALVIERIDRFDYQYWAAPLAALAALAVMGRLERLTLAAYGFSKPSKAVRELLIGFLVGGTTMSLIVGIMSAKGWYHGRLMPMTDSLLGSLGNTLAIFFGLAIFEEAVYRGYFFQTLERRWGPDIAFAATMVTFGLMHLTINVPGASVSLKIIGALSIAVEAGILFAAAYLLTRRLWLPIGIHCAWNFFEGPVYGTPVTGNNLGETLFAGHISGPAWATGGGFGPEASIPALLVGTFLGLVLLWLAQRRRQRHPS